MLFRSKMVRTTTFDKVRRGGYVPEEHLKDMDADGVDVSIVYPTVGLLLYSVPDSALLSEIFRAYNDWLAEFCTAEPKRLKGIAMINVDEVQEGIKELERCAKMGLAGGMITVYPPEGKGYDHPMYEPLWAAAQDLAMPLSLHTGTRRWRPGGDGNDPTLVDIVERANKEHDVRIALAAMVFAGVFERYPRLKVGAVEFEVAWAPYFLARMDNLYTEQAIGVSGRRFKGGAVPSDFCRQNIFLSFQEDAVGIQLRALLGVETLLWGSDYPHAESTFPRSRAIVERILQGVPDEEKVQIAGGNTARLYRFD